MAEVSRLTFSLKYFFRLIHIFSFAMLFGNVSYDLFIRKRTSPQDIYRKIDSNLNILFYILIIISGLTNMILLILEKKYNKDLQYEIWKKSLIIKTIITIFITPLLEAVISIGVKEEERIDSIALPIRFTFMLIMTVISPFLRYYREYYMTSPVESFIKSDLNHHNQAINESREQAEPLIGT